MEKNITPDSVISALMNHANTSNTLFRRERQGWYKKLSCYSANKVTPDEQD